VLFGVQLGGGTDINSALAYCEKQIEIPAKTHLVLITDLYEGGDSNSMLARAAAIKQSGVNLIVLLALSDAGHPAYEAKHAEAIASLGCPVFAFTPDPFPSMMAVPLQYDVTRDGDRFLMIGPLEGAVSEPATVVLNWEALLKK